MNIQVEKCMKIISNLVAFCHQGGSCDYDMHLECGEGSALMELSLPASGLSEDRLAVLKAELSLPRQREVEFNYWELSGEMESDDDLTLLGMMVDEVSISCEGERLRIRLWRRA